MDNAKLSRPKVQVKIPNVTVRLADLAFLHSLSQPRAIRCHPSRSTLDRLRFLDLIARASIQPTKEAKAAVEQARRQLAAELNKAIRVKDYAAVGSAAYALRRLRAQLEPKEDDVLTEKGKALLEHGEVKVRVRKVGCVNG